MGLFDFLKKKPSTVKIEMVGYENGKKVKLNFEHQESTSGLWDISITPTLNRVIKPLENRMVEHAVSAKKARKIYEKKKALEGVVKTYYEIRKKCNQLGPEYQKYFSIMWEHCRNSRNPDFSYIERFEKELDDLESNYSELSAAEAIHDRESVNLEERVISLLKESNDILQTDVYKQFHPSVKADIQSILYELEKKGRVERIKSGRTYIVHYLPRFYGSKEV